MKQLSVISTLTALVVMGMSVANVSAATTTIPRVQTTYLTTQWPVVSPVYSSPFGPRLKASSNYRYDFHRGVDFPKPIGTPVFSIAGGTIYGIYSATDSTSPYYVDGGNVVIVKHTLTTPYTIHGKTTTTLYSLYMHLDTIDPVLVKGGTVQIGQQLGTVGQT
jgi:murein DD-endopeptidase MepM/ murein hydrolase activator NlpD